MKSSSAFLTFLFFMFDDSMRYLERKKFGIIDGY
jgi:hypothetical protein